MIWCCRKYSNYVGTRHTRTTGPCPSLHSFALRSHRPLVALSHLHQPAAEWPSTQSAPCNTLIRQQLPQHPQHRPQQSSAARILQWLPSTITNLPSRGRATGLPICLDNVSHDRALLAPPMTERCRHGLVPGRVSLDACGLKLRLARPKVPTRQRRTSLEADASPESLVTGGLAANKNNQVVPGLCVARLTISWAFGCFNLTGPQARVGCECCVRNYRSRSFQSTTKPVCCRGP